MEIIGYCDESGTEGKAQVLVVAGLLAPANRWERFEADWKLILAAHRIDYFRAHDFYKRKKQFALGTVWDSQFKRDQLVQQLLQVVQSHETAPATILVSLVYLEEYRRVFGKTNRLSVGTAYTIGCTGCWWLAAKWAEETNHEEEISFFFDEGHQHARDALDSYHRTRIYEPYRVQYRLGGLTFDDDRRRVPLQAADLLAYGVTQSLRRSANWRDIDPVIRQYVGDRPYKVLVAEGEWLQHLHDETVRQLRERGKKI